MAQRDICRLEDEGINVSYLQDALDKVRAENKNSKETKYILQNVKVLCRKIEDLDSKTEWERLENKIKNALFQLGKFQEVIQIISTKADKIIESKDVNMGYDIIERINALNNITKLFNQK